MENSEKYLLHWILFTLFADWLRQYFNVPFPSRMSYNVNRIIRNRVHAFQFAINASPLPRYSTLFRLISPSNEQAKEEIRTESFSRIANFSSCEKERQKYEIPRCIKNKSVRK